MSTEAEERHRRMLGGVYSLDVIDVPAKHPPMYRILYKDGHAGLPMLWEDVKKSISGHFRHLRCAGDDSGLTQHDYYTPVEVERMR